MVDLAATVWRDFVTDGVPASGPNKPLKSKIRAWGAYVESRQVGAGNLYTYSSTTTDADPGAGTFRLNNATVASATALYIDNLDASGVDIGTVIAGWDDSTSSVRGVLTIRGIDNSTAVRVYNVTGTVVDGTGYRKVTIAYVGGSGAFVDGNQYLITFSRTGDKAPSNFASITDYGAIGDGDITNAAANAAALTAALATGKQVWIPYTSSGYHFGTNQIAVGSGQVIVGENQVLLKSTATTSLFRLTGFEITSGIHNVKIDMTGSGASSTAIRFGTGSATVYRVRLSKIKFANCVEAIGQETHASNAVVDLIIDDCMCWLTRGRQIYLSRTAGFILVRSTNVDFTQDTGLVAWEGIRFENFAGLELERVDVLGWGTGTRAYNNAIYGIVISNGQALWLTRVFVDSYLGVGIFINAASYVFSNYLETSLCNGLGILLATVSKGVFTNTLINGNTGVTGAAAGAQGLYLDTVTDCTFSTTLVYNMSGSGIAAINANNRVTFTGTVTNTNLFGIALQGTSANVVFNGGSMNGNGTAVSNTASGAGNAIRNINGYNPVGAAAVTTAASPWTYTAGASPETLYFSASTGISAVTQSGGTSILPAALAANVPMTVELDPGQAVVITYTGTLTAKKMVH